MFKNNSNPTEQNQSVQQDSQTVAAAADAMNNNTVSSENVASPATGTAPKEKQRIATTEYRYTIVNDAGKKEDRCF